MGGFGRQHHVTEELIVFGHLETKVHSRRCLLPTNLAEGDRNHRILGDFFAMPGANCSIYGCRDKSKAQ